LSAQPEDEPSPEELAAALAFQLKRLEAMQKAGEKLLQQPRVGQDVFPRGMADGIGNKVFAVYDTSLWDLLGAYGHIMLADSSKSMEIEAFDLYAMDDAIRRLRDMFGGKVVPSWTELLRFMPGDLKSPLKRRSALAAHFVASLEMCRDGELEIRQSDLYGPILLRSPQTRREEASE
jgi:segregation and condensation protein A